MITLSALAEKIDNLSIRERGAILFGILAVLYSVWDAFLMQPLVNQQKIIKAEVQQKQAEQAALAVQIQKVIKDNREDPNLKLEKVLNALKAELKEITTTIQASTAHLVTPGDMAKILETMLNKTRGLTLLSMTGLGATALVDKNDKGKTTDKTGQSTSQNESKETGEVESAQPEPAQDDMGNAYKHGIRIEFEGDFMATLEYLHELESLEWEFFWDSLEFKVEEYPRSRAVIQVFTLSLHKDWIDV